MRGRRDGADVGGYGRFLAIHASRFNIFPVRRKAVNTYGVPFAVAWLAELVKLKMQMGRT